MLRKTSSDVSERVDDLIVVQPAAGGVQTQTLSRWRQAGESPVILLPNQRKGVNGRALPGYPGVQVRKWFFTNTTVRNLRYLLHGRLLEILYSKEARSSAE